VLAAIIIDAVVFGMMDIPEMRRLWRVKRIDFWIAVAAIVGVLSAGILAGVVIGMVLSVGWLVYVNSLPAMSEVGREPGTTAFRPLREYPDGETYQGLLVVRLDGGLTFVTADGFLEGIRERYLSSEEPVTGVIVDFAGVNFVDSQGAAQLRRLVELGAPDGPSFRFARVRTDVMTVLHADGFVDEIGEDRFYPNLDRAVAEELAERTGRSAATP
jgi:SulP family sulfate permease